MLECSHRYHQARNQDFSEGVWVRGKKRKNRNVAKVGKGIVLIERRIAGRGLSEGGGREEDGAGGQNEDDIG